MNFIGHAAVALSVVRSRGQARAATDHPAFVLGSMLPDFAGMARTRLTRATGQGALAEGIALHHRTDDIFHAAPLFTELLQCTLDELCAAGIARGTARAVAHIGTEMLIDGELVHEPAVATAYLEALQVDDPLADSFVDAEGALRFSQLRARLLSFGVPFDYREPEAVLWRLQRVLAGRPRLAIDPAAMPGILAQLPRLQARVVTVVPALLQSVCEAVR